MLKVEKREPKKFPFFDTSKNFTMTGLLERARRDIERITSNKETGWGVEMTFVAPDSTSATVVGTHTKHHLKIDTDGDPVSSKVAHVAVSEKVLIDAGYPLRNVAGEVDLRKHKVTVKDSTGNDCTYVINVWFPDETIGLIVINLGDYE